MKRILFATTATAALAFGGMASAQGIALFGDARLGLGYNIENDGDALGGDQDEDVRAISRVRFGVNMTGETNSGITFGATIRADNSPGGQGGSTGQTAGNAFVSGNFGTLTFGDTNGADEQHVGDLNEVGLTCLGCENETFFISNGGGFGDDENDFASNPFARPTIRYDFDIAGFGLSVSSNRDLTDVGVGGSYTLAFGAGSATIGAGYYDFDGFSTFGDSGFAVIEGEVVEVEGVETFVSSGDQWSVSIGGEFAGFSLTGIYTSADSSDAEFETLGAGVGTTFGDFGVDAYYVNIFDASGDLEGVDGDDSYGLGVTYDLGGGARIEGGVADTFAGETVADFGIGMSF